MGPASSAKRRRGVNQSAMHQAVRYGLVGGCVFAADLAVYWTTLQIAPPAYLVANAAGKIAGALLGFALHKRFTFIWQQKDCGSRQLISYLCLFLANLALSSALLSLLVAGFGVHNLLAKILVDAVVIATSFVVSRHWVYRAA